MNKITVLMPSYNRGQYITEAVNSVLNQKTEFGVKLIITDDCSTDGSVEKIKDFHKNYPDKIEIILSDKNERLLSNILKAQMRVETEYFCVLDPDDYYIDELFLQKAVDFLDTHRGFTIYSSNCMMMYGDNSTHPYIKMKKHESVFTFDDLLQDNVYITQTAGTVFRNVVYNNGVPGIIKNAVGTNSEASFREDTCRYIIHLHEGSAVFKNEFVAIYRIHNNGIWSGVSDFTRSLRACKQFYDLSKYFNHKFSDYFINLSFEYARNCIKYLYDSIDKIDLCQITDMEGLNLLFNTVNDAFPYINLSNQNSVCFSKKYSIKKIIKYLLPHGLYLLLSSNKNN